MTAWVLEKAGYSKSVNPNLLQNSFRNAKAEGYASALIFPGLYDEVVLLLLVW
jgi:hypothetical protein